MARLGEVRSVVEHRPRQPLEEIAFLGEADRPGVLPALALPVTGRRLLGREAEILPRDARRGAGDGRGLLTGPARSLRSDVRNRVEAPAAAHQRPDPDARPLLAVERLDDPIAGVH